MGDCVYRLSFLRIMFSLESVLAEREPEHIIYDRIHETPDSELDSINLPQSSEFFLFNEYRIHARTYWPAETQEVKGIALFLHGYIAHSNRPTNEYMGKLLAAHGFIFLTFDFPGHGYSSGLKAYIPDPALFIECGYTFLEKFYSAVKNRVKSDPEQTYFFDIQQYCSLEVPMFLMGQSMGGGFTVLLADRLKESNSSFPFHGCILLCPLLAIKSPPIHMRMFLDYIVTPFLGNQPLPDWLASANDEDEITGNADYVRYLRHDSQKGISYDGKIRFGTASSLLKVPEAAQEVLPSVDYPFIIFHDRNDKMVPFSGAENMMARSQTDASRKRLVEIKDGGHGFLVRQLGKCGRDIIAWLEEELHHSYAVSNIERDLK